MRRFRIRVLMFSGLDPLCWERPCDRSFGTGLADIDVMANNFLAGTLPSPLEVCRIALARRPKLCDSEEVAEDRVDSKDSATSSGSWLVVDD